MTGFISILYFFFDISSLLLYGGVRHIIVYNNHKINIRTLDKLSGTAFRSWYVMSHIIDNVPGNDKTYLMVSRFPCWNCSMISATISRASPNLYLLISRMRSAISVHLFQAWPDQLTSPTTEYVKNSLSIEGERRAKPST